MISNKKGIQPHIIVIIFVAIIMTILFLTVLSFLFKTDDANCTFYAYQVRTCNDNGNIKFTFKNTGNKAFNFKLNDEVSDDYEVPIKETKTIYLNNSKASIVEIMPYVKGGMNDKEVGVCYSLSKNVRVDALGKC